MVDANLVLQASVTKTASFNGAAVDLKSGTPRRGMVARVNYAAASNASGSNTVTFSIEHSDDGSTWYALNAGAAHAVALSTTAQAGEIGLAVVSRKRYLRLVCTISGAGTSPTVTYYGDLGLGFPG